PLRPWPSPASWPPARSSSLRSCARPAAQPITYGSRRTCTGSASGWRPSDDTLFAAVDLQKAMLSAGMHRKPIPDLIIASVAQDHDAVLQVRLAAHRREQAVAVGQPFDRAWGGHQQWGAEQVQQGELVGVQRERVDPLDDAGRWQVY